MAHIDYNFYDRMVAAQAVAQHRRNRGEGTGSHSSWTRKRHLGNFLAHAATERHNAFAAIKQGYQEDLHFWRNPEFLTVTL